MTASRRSRTEIDQALRDMNLADDDWPEEDRGESWEGPPAGRNGCHDDRVGKGGRTEPPPREDQGGPDPGPPVEIFTAAELLAAELPEPRYAVDGILPEGLNVLAGKPKLGKSWLALNVCAAVACGGVALGSVKVERGEVLYLALEDTKRRLQSRLKKMLRKQQGEAPPGLHLARVWPRQDQGGLLALAEWLAHHQGARLVVIDTWAKFRPAAVGRNRDPYQDDYDHAGQVKALADARGVAVLLLHHCRKLGATDPLDEVSGTVGMTGAADGIQVLRRERGEHDAALHVTGRDVDEQEVALRWDPEYALWSILGEAAQYRLSKERNEVLGLLARSKEPLAPKKVAELLDKNVGTVKSLLWHMHQDGQITGLPDGTYRSANRANSANQG